MLSRGITGIPDNPCPDHWQASWMWYPEYPLTNGNRYFRRTFRLDSIPTFARGWFTGSSRCNVYVNGVRVLVFDWSPDFPNRVDFLHALKIGENVIAIDAHNEDFRAWVMGELYMGYPGQPDKVILTGPDWQCSKTPDDGWLAPDFRGNWLHAVFIRPGIWVRKIADTYPYEYMGTRDKAFVSNVIVSNPHAQRSVPVSISMIGTFDHPVTKENRIMLELSRNDELLLAHRTGSEAASREQFSSGN